MLSFTASNLILQIDKRQLIVREILVENFLLAHILPSQRVYK